MGNTFDVLFMNCTVSENGGGWDFLTAILKMLSRSFQGIVKKFVDLIGRYMYKRFVKNKVLYYYD